MKHLLLTLFIVLAGFSNAQDADTTIIYTINKTNKLIQVSTSEQVVYTLEFRDLNALKEIRKLHFDSEEKMAQFFDLSFKALESDVGTMIDGYSVKRKTKSVLRVGYLGGYCFINYNTLEKMKDAYERRLED